VFKRALEHENLLVAEATAREIGHVSGVGRLLFEHVATKARQLGARRLEWEAEPNARSFYERMGGAYVRDSEVTEWGRVLEVLGLSLARE